MTSMRLRSSLIVSASSTLRELGDGRPQLRGLDLAADPRLTGLSEQHERQLPRHTLLVARGRLEDVLHLNALQRHRQLTREQHLPHLRAQALGAGEPQRREQAESDRLAVSKARVAGGRLDRMPDRVAEVEHLPAPAVALIRRDAPCPIASGETLLERRDFRPYFEAYAFDTAIVDVIWNGFLESLKIAAMADVYEVNVAPHNFYGHLASVISAHFCAAVPNFRIMEIDIDDVPWKDDLVTHPPVIQNGELIVPTRPGWGADINEEAVRAHPPKNPHP